MTATTPTARPRTPRGRLARWVALCALSSLAGCTSIPLSTLWKLRDFTVESFFAKDPAQLRVAVLTEKSMKRGPNAPLIDIRVKAASTKRICYAFALDPVDASQKSEVILERPAADRRWYVFALSPAGIDAFRQAQRDAKIKRQEETEIEVGITMTKVLETDGTPFPMRIDLVLDRRDGYFTLIKETTVDPSKYKPDPSKKPTPTPTCGTES